MLHFSEPLIRGVSGGFGGFRELSRGFPGDPPHLGGSRGGSPRTPRGYPPDWRSGGVHFLGFRGYPGEDPGRTPEIDDFRDFCDFRSGTDFYDFLHFLQKFGILGFFAIFWDSWIFPDFYKIRDRGFL